MMEEARAGRDPQSNLLTLWPLLHHCNSARSLCLSICATQAQERVSEQKNGEHVSRCYLCTRCLSCQSLRTRTGSVLTLSIPSTPKIAGTQQVFYECVFKGCRSKWHLWQREQEREKYRGLLNLWQADLHALFLDRALSTAIFGAGMCAGTFMQCFREGVRNGASSDKIFTVNSPFPPKAMQWKLFPSIRVHRGKKLGKKWQEGMLKF